MSIIYVDELAIRLPSEVRNTFNPLCAFGSCSSNSNNNRSSTSVMGLREVQSGHLLLPIDAEGSIVVTPGQRYTVVLVRETRRGAAASAAAPPVGAESSSAASNGHQSSTDGSTNRAKKSAAPVNSRQQQLQPQQMSAQHQHQHQQPAKQPSLPCEAAATAPIAPPAMPPVQKDSLSKKERKAMLELSIAEQVHGDEAPRPPTVAESDQFSKKRKRQDDDAARAQQQQQRRQKLSPTTNARVGAADTDDAPLMEAYKCSQSHTSSRTSPVIKPPTSAEIGHHSNRGPLRSKAETLGVPPQPMRRSLSSTDSYDDEEGAPSLAQLYSTQSAVSQYPVPEVAHTEEETRTSATSKRRHSPSEKKTKSISSDAAVSTAAPRASSQSQPATKTLHQKSVSPDRVPVTLPPSSRTSTVRRVPLDTSSDSD
ncbi:hypothetical protein, conserved [Leishmania lindenbergi]|uniref:Uncharacterized protein n=1 Tax=Leishmania lindenbergi TaxID=651832 RepID=A0AAW2ZYT9_9TRYP